MDDFNKILSKIFWISGIILLILIFTKFIKELRLSYVIEIGNAIILFYLSYLLHKGMHKKMYYVFGRKLTYIMFIISYIGLFFGSLVKTFICAN